MKYFLIIALFIAFLVSSCVVPPVEQDDDVFILKNEMVLFYDIDEFRIDLVKAAQADLDTMDFFRFNYILLEKTGDKIPILGHYVAMKLPEVFLWRNKDGRITSMGGRSIRLEMDHLDSGDVQVKDLANRLKQR